MSCADFLEADAQMQAAMKADPQAAVVDDKLRAYCKANPKASSSEAMTKAMQ